MHHYIPTNDAGERAGRYVADVVRQHGEKYGAVPQVEFGARESFVEEEE
jgi:hypothetical protein